MALNSTHLLNIVGYPRPIIMWKPSCRVCSITDISFSNFEKKNISTPFKFSYHTVWTDYERYDLAIRCSSYLYNPRVIIIRSSLLVILIFKEIHFFLFFLKKCVSDLEQLSVHVLTQSFTCSPLLKCFGVMYLIWRDQKGNQKP